MKFIALTQNKFALVDEEDYGYLSKHKWHYAKGYAARQAPSQHLNGKRKRVWMHRQIFPPPVGFEIDHVNGNGIDNRRHNLRIATHRQNGHNRKIAKHNKLRIKGVIRQDDHFKATIVVDGNKLYLGFFKTLEQASDAYRKAAIKHFGKFARV